MTREKVRLCFHLFSVDYNINERKFTLFPVNTKYILSRRVKISLVSPVLRTREITDSHQFLGNIFGINFKKSKYPLYLKRVKPRKSRSGLEASIDISHSYCPASQE